MKKEVPAEQKKFNKIDVFALAFGAMIGWGWVILSNEWILKAGAYGAALAFVLGGIVMLLVGQVFAELVSAMPSSAGVMLYTKRAFGHGPSFWCTWSLLLASISVIAFEGVALPSVVEYLIPNFLQGHLYTVAGFDVYFSWLAVGIVSSLLIAAINYVGTKSALILQTAMTLTIVAVGLMLCFGSVKNGSAENMKPLFKDGIGGIFSVAVMTPFMYVGFDVVPQTASEMNIKPQNIAKLLLVSVVAAVIWYAGIIICVSRALPHDVMASSSLATADAMAYVYGGSIWASRLLILGGIAGIISSWNSFYVSGSHIICTLAEDGMLPHCFAKIHPVHGTPSNAILLIAGVTTFAPLLGKNMLVWLSDAGGLGVVISLLMVSCAFLKLRKREPDMPRPYRAGKSSLLGWLAVIACVALGLLYVIPGAPSALKWPYEWGIILLWFGMGAVLFAIPKKL